MLRTNIATSSIASFNYNTGELVGEVSVGAVSYPLLGITSAGNFLLGDYSTPLLRNYNSAGTLISTFTPPAGAATVRAIGQAPDGNIFVAFGGTNAITKYTSSGVLVGNVATGISGLGDSRQMVFQGNQVVLALGNSGKWGRFDYTATAWTNYSEVSVPSSFVYGAAAGHFNTIYSGGYLAGPVSIINSYHRSTGVQRSTFTIPGTLAITSIACVVAPEPSGLAFLGLASLVFLRRKR
ncbi:MAG: hypothetical protein K8R88_11245 [Armatimonadetes bacterium]|nr:hypothetical protein [Armatimonadota bacterium]